MYDKRSAARVELALGAPWMLVLDPAFATTLMNDSFRRSAEFGFGALAANLVRKSTATGAAAYLGLLVWCEGFPRIFDSSLKTSETEFAQ